MPDDITSIAAASNSGLGKARAEKKAAPTRREIPGNLPYLMAHGTLRNILNKVIELPRPDKFNYDFLENIVKISGGNARACIPIMKKMGFLNSDNSTTDLYGKFRTEGGRGFAAYQGLKNAYSEIFKRSDYAYSIEDSKLKDIIVEITGLNSSDSIAKAIRGTFNVIKEYIAKGFNHESGDIVDEDVSSPEEVTSQQKEQRATRVGIAYNINIVLPETSDTKTLNAIFKALKENLL